MTPPFDTHPSLPVPHGFFGRRGGVSDGAYESLNAGLRSGDARDHVEENRARIRQTLDAEVMVSLRQVHSDRVVVCGHDPVGHIEADGMVTRIPKLALGILTADCGPVLLADAGAGIVGACHAGWRGALGGIVENTVAAMCELGARTGSISAVLGPCIAPDSYEVGDAFKAEFLAVSDDYTRFFRPGPTGTPHFDLPGFILSRLEACGVGIATWTGHDTYAHPDRYFSYRRNTHQGISGYGRNLSAIMLPG